MKFTDASKCPSPACACNFVAFGDNLISPRHFTTTKNQPKVLLNGSKFINFFEPFKTEIMFGDESSVFGTPSGSVDASVWKPHPSHDLSNHNSKLNTWAPPGTRNKDFVYDDASAKAAWNSGRSGANIGGDKPLVNAWGPPELVSNDLALETELMQMSIGKPPEQYVGHGGPPQWGRQEVNQATPWDVDANGMARPPFGGPEGMPGPPPGRGFMQQPMHFDNGNQQWRQWDNDFGGNKGPEFPGPEFPGPPFGAPQIPGQFNHGRMNNFVPPQQGNFNERMPFQIRNGPPLHHGGPHQPQQPWMDNKFGGHQMHHPMNQPNPQGRFPFGHPGQQPPPNGPPNLMIFPFGHPGQQPPPNGPPNLMMSGRPPLMAMQPPHHPHHPTNPPPNFQMGTFQPSMPNDDAFWQDPNGELRKWQRDTGTAVWGDPAKQNSSEIRRWIQPPSDSDEENILTPDPLREGKEDMESGWGPPPAPPGQKGQPGNVMPQPMNPMGWNEPIQRGPPQTGQFVPPGPAAFHPGPVPTGPPANGWGGNPSSADWTRSGAVAFQQQGGFDNFHANAANTNNQPEDARRLADKIRLLERKGYLDVSLLNNINNQPPAILQQLNHMLHRVQQLDALEMQAKRICFDPQKKAELDKLHEAIDEEKRDLEEYKNQIHAALRGSSGSTDEMPSEEQLQDLAPTSLGSGVGQLCLNFVKNFASNQKNPKITFQIFLTFAFSEKNTPTQNYVYAFFLNSKII
uniref:Uncharacterized protein n=1 Tax=Panagrolaimus sp. JU765 TaxID=591449 RepID=A0AC34QX55_9BILA